MRSISSSVTVSAVRSYSFVVLGDAWPAICWACSSVPPFDRYAVIGLFAGGGEILRLARPASRSSGFRMQGPSGPAPAAGPDHRLLGDGGVVPPARPRSAPGRRLAGAAPPLRRHAKRRCCRLPPSLMPTAARRLRPVRTTGSPSAGSLRGLRRLAAAARAGAVAGGSIEDSVLRVERTETAVPDGAADLVADPLPADARGAAGRTPGAEPVRAPRNA